MDTDNSMEIVRGKGGMGQGKQRGYRDINNSINNKNKVKKEYNVMI